MYICVYVSVRIVYIYIYIYTCTYIYIYVCMLIHIHTFMHACMHACMHPCIHASLHLKNRAGLQGAPAKSISCENLEPSTWELSIYYRHASSPTPTACGHSLPAHKRQEHGRSVLSESQTCKEVKVAWLQLNSLALCLDLRHLSFLLLPSIPVIGIEKSMFSMGPKRHAVNHKPLNRMSQIPSPTRT